MYKLLPPQAVSKAKREYSIRRVFVISSLLLGLFALSIACIAPSLIFALKKKEAVTFTLESINKTGQKSDTTLELWAEKIKTNLNRISPDENPDQPYTFFQKVLKSKTSGIKINNLVWSKQNNNTKNIKISGVAKTRQSLLAFQSSLNNSGDWAQVDLPVGAIAREADIPFEIALTPQKTK